MEITKSILTHKEFCEADGTTVAGQQQRMKIIVDSGLPPMRLLPAKYILQEKRLPKYSEGQTIDAIDAFKKPGASIIYLTHRWLKPDQPDDEHNSKALTLVEFINFYVTHRQFQSDPNGIFIWCDWCCIDQENPLPGIAALPCYIAVCKIFLCFATDDFQQRAWCCTEQAIASSCSRFGSTPWLIRQGFTSLTDGDGHFRKLEPIQLLDQFQTVGEVTKDDDRPLLEALVDLGKNNMMLKNFLGAEMEQTPFGKIPISYLEPLPIKRPNSSKASARILAISPSAVGLTTIIRQAADTWGTGFTDDGRDRRSKTYDHYFAKDDREFVVTELGVNASGVKGLQKMLMMIGAGDAKSSSSGLNLVLFAVSLDQYDQFSEEGENRLLAATKMFGTVQRSLDAGIPTLIVFNMIDKFHEKSDVKGMCEAIFADFDGGEPINYFKKLFKDKNVGTGKLEFVETNGLDNASCLAAFTMAIGMIPST